MNNFTTEQIINAYKKKGYHLKTGKLELNLFGIRNKDSQANTFDDVIGAIYVDENSKWQSLKYAGTTDPGIYYRENPMNVEGTAIMAPGQYLDCYKIGLHHGYEAFQQIGKMGYVRDNDKNKLLNFALYLLRGNIKYEIAATNIHYSNPEQQSQVVDKWSAGCQVLALAKNLKLMLGIAKQGISSFLYKNLFDYALFESNEI